MWSVSTEQRNLNPLKEYSKYISLKHKAEEDCFIFSYEYEYK
jgi:hypothetical protein